MNAKQLDGWIPIRFYWRDGRPLVDWCWIGTKRLSESFFDETITKCLHLPFSSLFRPQSTIDTLAQRYEIKPGLEPSGFIFHMSRCGSTLLAQMLAALPGSITISEARPIDMVLRARFQDPALTDSTRAEWLKWMVSALGQRRGGDEKSLFIKFDSWSVLELPLIRRAFPRVPWVFVYRDPLEVLLSQLSHRGAHMVPGAIEPELFGMTADEVFGMQPEHYCAKVLARICEAALRYHRNFGGTMINYRQLPDVAWTSIADLFGIELSAADIHTSHNASKIDAKNHALSFVPVSRTGRRSPSEAARDAVEQWLSPVYAQLEAARLNSEKDS